MTIQVNLVKNNVRGGPSDHLIAHKDQIQRPTLQKINEVNYNLKQVVLFFYIYILLNLKHLRPI